MDSQQIITLLLDIKQQQGVHGQQLLEAARSTTDLKETQQRAFDKIEELSVTVTPLAISVKDMKPKVDTLMTAHNRFGGVLVTLTAVWGFLAGGIAYFSDIIKAKFHL